MSEDIEIRLTKAEERLAVLESSRQEFEQTISNLLSRQKADLETKITTLDAKTADADAALQQHDAEIEQKLQSETAHRQEDFLQAAPIGTIVAFGGPNIPNGWRLCNGDRVTADQYPKLWQAIGIAWGGDNNAKSFNLPDLNGMFLRGVDTVGNRDLQRGDREAIRTGGHAGAQVGSLQHDSTRLPRNAFTTTGGDHRHRIPWSDQLFPTQYGAAAPGNNGLIKPGQLWTVETEPDSHGISGGDNETRPANAYVHFIIRVA